MVSRLVMLSDAQTPEALAARLRSLATVLDGCDRLPDRQELRHLSMSQRSLYAMIAEGGEAVLRGEVTWDSVEAPAPIDPRELEVRTPANRTAHDPTWRP